MAAEPGRLRVVIVLGTAQILAWGASYYLPAVLATPIAVATGWPHAWVIGGLSLGLLVSGLVSPRIGRLIGAHGGRPVLAASAILLALGLVMIALAPSIVMFLAGWAMIGVGMGAGLYDPAFATLGRLYGEQARVPITQITLIAGFSSTICWPLSAYLVVHLGWQLTCLVYAGLLVGTVLPCIGSDCLSRRTRYCGPFRRRPNHSFRARQGAI